MDRILKSAPRLAKLGQFPLQVLEGFVELQPSCTCGAASAAQVVTRPNAQVPGANLAWG